MMYFILDLFRKLSMRLFPLLSSTVTARKPVRAPVDVRHINNHLPQQILFSHSDNREANGTLSGKNYEIIWNTADIAVRIFNDATLIL